MELTNDQTGWTVRLLSALLDSASVDIIGTANWWTRAQTALEAGAAGADSAAGALSIMTRKLQIPGSYRPDANTTIVELVPLLDADFGAWQEKVRREAPYLVALCRAYRQSTKPKKQAPKKTATHEATPKPEHTAGASLFDEEIPF